MLGDCLERMNEIPDGSIDAIICDLPYGTTACKWDTVIPMEAMWHQIKRIVKPKSAIVLFGSQPFSSVLVNSNLKNFAFAWCWDKCFGGNFVQASRLPIKTHEDILVFCKGGTQPNYYPQMTKRDVPIKKGGNKQSEAIPIGQTEHAINYGKMNKVYDEKFPTSQLTFNVRVDRGFHPTQKPVALLEYLVKTYTLENETVLDFCAGSGSTGVACVNTNRNFIGIERDETYFNIGAKRVNDAILKEFKKQLYSTRSGQK